MKLSDYFPLHVPCLIAFGIDNEFLQADIFIAHQEHIKVGKSYNFFDIFFFNLVISLT